MSVAVFLVTAAILIVASFSVVTGRDLVRSVLWLAVALITLASILLSAQPGGNWGFSFGAVLILAGCVLWGLDNNLTRKVSAGDPVQIVFVKM